jgi:hypothetical protein
MPEIADYTYRLHKQGDHLSIFQIYNQEVGDTSYYQYENNEGQWYIMKSVRSGAATVYTYYFGGSSNIDTGWTNRASHTYTKYSDQF